MKTSLYVDGFNVYYGCFKRQRRRCAPADKWLDWRALAEKIAGADSTVHQIHYFTAHVHRSTSDPDQNLRQELYFRAIDAIPGVQIHYGKHIPVTRLGQLVKPDPASLGVWPKQLVTIEMFEEKGSDVNLAVKLVDDAWAKEVDRAIVLSNDTDLISAIKVARRHIRVDVVSPQEFLAKELKKAASYSWTLDVALLRQCRMPVPQISRDGVLLYPPDSWTDEHWPERRDDD